MIRIILLGRTGNILFQYALGRVLAKKHAVPLVLDASWYNRQGWEEVSHLLRLPLRAKVVRPFPFGSRALRKLTGRHHLEWIGKPVLRESENNQSFDPRFLAAPSDCILFGYFQTPLYFHPLEEELRSELQTLLSLGATVEGGNELLHPSAVAVHVRRGDYLVHPALIVCEESYYRRAMDRMRSLVSDARFHIFSDDRAWCHSTFRDADTSVIDSGPLAVNPLHDLRLMSLASHHIIANSSYSWWAAWLGKKSGQQVIMPDRWYRGGIIAPIVEKRLPHWETVAC